MSRVKAAAIIAAIAICLGLAASYVHGVKYYSGHFLPGTHINGEDVSKMTVDEAAGLFDTSGWRLSIKDIDGSVEEIDADSAGVSADISVIEDAMKAQSALAWPAAAISPAETDTALGLSYSEESLAEALDGLAMCDPERREAPEDAYVSFDSEKERYTVVPDTVGTLVDSKALSEAVSAAMEDISLDGNSVEVTGDMLVKAAIDEDDDALVDAVNRANTMLGTDVTYEIDGIPDAERIGYELVSEWVSVTKDGKVSVDEDAVRSHLRSIGSRYDTVGTERTVALPDGRTVTLSGPYGWVTDEASAFDDLMVYIEEGADVETVFPVKQSAAGAKGQGELGGDVVEVDLTHQWLRLWKGGSLTMSVPIVSGADGHSTPTGLWYYTNKYTDTILRGPLKPDGKYEWESHVDYWMAFVGNSIGCHDAVWRSSSEFSSSPDQTPTHYKAHGSHGCCNMRHADAEQLYGEMYLGMPVVVHW